MQVYIYICFLNIVYLVYLDQQGYFIWPIINRKYITFLWVVGSGEGGGGWLVASHRHVGIFYINKKLLPFLFGQHPFCSYDVRPDVIETSKTIGDVLDLLKHQSLSHCAYAHNGCELFNAEVYKMYICWFLLITSVVTNRFSRLE